MRATLLVFFSCLAMASPSLPAKAGGVVSLGGPVSEIVVALGAEERLVGVDSTSQHPPRLSQLPDVGYVRALSAEAILSLDPKLILATPAAGPPAVLSQLETAGLTLVRVPNEATPAGLGKTILSIAEALGREEQGRELAEQLERELLELRDALAEVETTPRALFLLSISRGATLAAGQGTTADAMIALAGGRNAAAELEGYKPLNAEAAVQMDPDIVLVSPETLEALGGTDALFAQPQLAGSSAARSKRLSTLDGQLLMGFGPRTADAVSSLAAALHPELAKGSGR